MARESEPKIVLVTRKTRLDELIVRFNTVQQAQFYVEHLGSDFSDYQTEDQTYKTAVGKAEEELRKWGILHKLDRSFLSNYLFGKKDTIVVIGQDGLVANTLKYLDGQPVIALNPDPSRWDGVLLPFKLPDLSSIIPSTLDEKARIQEVTMARAELNNREDLLAVNDFFIGPKSHTSARYKIHSGSKEERHSSSGIIVSTGLGSTGWFRSVLEGATGIASAVSSRSLKLKKNGSFPWDSDYLYFSVREPFPSKTTSTSLVFGKVSEQNPLHLESMMPENGVIFSDGIESDFLEFNSGTKATIGIAPTKGCLVVG